MKSFLMIRVMFFYVAVNLDFTMCLLQKHLLWCDKFLICLTACIFTATTFSWQMETILYLRKASISLPCWQKKKKKKFNGAMERSRLTAVSWLVVTAYVALFGSDIKNPDKQLEKKIAFGGGGRLRGLTLLLLRQCWFCGLESVMNRLPSRWNGSLGTSIFIADRLI